MPTKCEYFLSADENIFIDLRGEKGYTNEIEKSNRDDSDLAIIIQLKTLVAEKMILRVTGYYQGEYLYSMMRDDELQRVQNNHTKARN